MPVKEVGTKKEFDDIMAGSGGKLVVVDFFADWCGPCRMVSPKFVAYSDEYTDVIFLKINVDDNAEVAEECGISAMPTFQAFKGGQKVAEVVGANVDKLEAMIKENK